MKNWIIAARIRTLPLAWSSITFGSLLAYSHGYFDVFVYFLMLITAFGLQILSNLANDYGDAKSGVDGHEREGPQRMVQSGILSPFQMKRAILTTSLFTLIMGVWLIFYVFNDTTTRLIFLGLGLISILAALGYTLGKFPYSYSGWGDVFVLIFFGWLGVVGSYFFYTQQWHFAVFMPATSLGLLAVGVLNINNIRDIKSDKISGKNSIPVRIGRKNSIYYHFLLLFFPLLLMFFYTIQDYRNLWDALFLLTFPLLVYNGYGISKYKNSSKLDVFLKQLVLTTLLFVVLFGISVLLRGL